MGKAYKKATLGFAIVAGPPCRPTETDDAEVADVVADSWVISAVLALIHVCIMPPSCWARARDTLAKKRCGAD